MITWNEEPYIKSLVLWQKVQWNVWPGSFPRCHPHFSFRINTDTKPLSQRLSVCTTTQVFLMPMYVILLSKVWKPVLAPPTWIFKIHNSVNLGSVWPMVSQMFQMVTRHCIIASAGPGYLVQPSINSNSHCHKNFIYQQSHIKFTE